MALVPCPECGHSVSRQALACPSCGHPLHPAPGGGNDSGSSMPRQSAPPPAPPQSALHSPHVWGRVALAAGAWLAAPWIARVIVALAICVVAYFLFTGG